MTRFESVNKSECIAVAWFVAGLLLTGCAAKPTCYPPSLGLEHSQKPVTMGIDAQDFTVAANYAVASLLESGVFDRAPHHPAVLAVGKFFNETSQQLDTSLLPSQICAALLKTGKVVLPEKGQNAVDSLSHSDALSRPDFTLSGSVVETRERAWKITQSIYVFQFSLADSNSLTVWAENKEITKQAARHKPGL
jgi:PBP1b-binding outer membrane lipoprotein LpoB